MKKGSNLLIILLAIVLGGILLVGLVKGRHQMPTTSLANGSSSNTHTGAAAGSPPIGDSFTVPNFQPYYGILITNVEKDETGITIHFWRISDFGYVDHTYISTRVEATDPPPEVVTATPADRQKMLAGWQKRGFTARITTVDGQTVEYSNIFLYYLPPDGYVFTIYNNLIKTSLELRTGLGVRTVEFSEMASLSFSSGDLDITLRNGKKLSGQYVPPSYETHPYKPNIDAVQYAPDGTPLQDVFFPFANASRIEFLSWPGGN